MQPNHGMRKSLSDLTICRLSRGETQEQFAKRLKIEKSTLCRWEKGRVSASRVLDVERLTGISRHVLRPDIFGRRPPDPASQELAAV